MITLDAVRAAVLAEKPYTQMDELVRAEMAAGRKINDIFESLHPLTDDVLDTPSLSEDGEEAFLGTLDKLTGMCHADCQYYDPPNTTLPTEEEIAKLPRWARVAFAARCARRVLPLYLHFWPPGEVPYRVEAQSLQDLERLAADPNPQAQYSRYRVIYGTIFEGMPKDAALIASMMGELILPILTPTSQLQAVGAVVEKASSASGGMANLNPIFRRDFDHLAELARWRYWTDDTPVPPEVFGPLWPEGPPQGWPADPNAPKHDDLPIDLFVREKASSQMIEDDLVHLFKAMNAYHIARGGGLLTIEHLRPLLAALVPAEV